MISRAIHTVGPFIPGLLGGDNEQLNLTNQVKYGVYFSEEIPLVSLIMWTLITRNSTSLYHEIFLAFS